MTEKIDVNGEDRHPIYADLVGAPNEKGTSGDVSWNFEKFLVAADGTVVARFSPQVEPEDARLVDAVKAISGAE
jgi:glutathione peroxidase